jgi:TspO/MBR family
MIEQIVSLIAALMVLAAYWALQTKRVKEDDLLYLWLNLAGALVLSVIAFRLRQVGLIVIETVWALISVLSLIRRNHKDTKTQS